MYCIFYVGLTMFSVLTSKRYCARAGHRGKGVGRNTFIDPSILFGGLHDHQ